MAPAYLALMVLIFVAPLGRRPSKSASEVGSEHRCVDGTDIGQSQCVDRTAGAEEENHPAAELDAATAAEEAATEQSSSIPDSAGSAGAKPKRGRARARKAAKSAAETVLNPPPVTWIRVGPGKFVRADATTQAVDPAQLEEVAAEDVPATDTSDANPAISDVGDRVQVEEVAAEAIPATGGQDPLDISATIPDDVGMPIGSGDSVVGSVTEEYGITPSAFGPDPRISSAAERPDHDVSEVADAAEADRVSVPRRRARTARTGRISRGIAGAIPGVDRASSRRLVRTRPKNRTSAWSPFAPNARLQQATRRAFGRIPHVYRALRPRSPPHR
jgi:hypothetical protein